MTLKILYEDDTLLVIDKPAGVSVESIAVELEYTPAHRLDKDTSGVLLLAKTPQALDQLQREFQQRQVEKRYTCLVEGEPKEESGLVHTLLARSPADRRKQRTYPPEQAKEGRREAVTEWKVLRRFEGYTMLEARPKTGRKHQIRAHMASLGFPVAGDKLYGFKNQRIPKGLTRQFLHASSIRLHTPNGSLQEFTAELPQDVMDTLQELQPKED